MSITTIVMCQTTKCRNTADPDGSSPILQRARSSCDLMAPQYFNDMDAGKMNDNLNIAHHENEVLLRTQFAPNVEDPQDFTEIVDENFKERGDDFPLIKDVTSEAVWHDASENDASLKDKEECLMATNCVIDVDSGPPQGSNKKCAGDYTDDEDITPPPPLPPSPPQKMTFDDAPQLPPITAPPSVVSE